MKMYSGLPQALLEGWAATTETHPALQRVGLEGECAADHEFLWGLNAECQDTFRKTATRLLRRK